MIRKSMSLILAALLLVLTCAACSQSTENAEVSASNTTATQSPENTDAAAAEPEADDPYTTRMAENDNLPEYDFGGRDFIVLGSAQEGFGIYLAVDELNGEGVNDAVYKRNLTVEERFNAKTVYEGGADYGTCSNLVAKAVKAGDADSYDLIQYHVVSSSGNAMKNYYLNWYDIPNVDFSRSWWSKSNTEDLTIAGKCFLAMGDFALSTVGRSYVMLYDRDEAKNYQLEDFYPIVKEGRWTIDTLKTICAQVYTDRNGDGIENDGDYYAMGTDIYSNLNTYFWSTGNLIFSRGDSGELEFHYYSEHLVDAYDKCWDFLNQTPGIFKKGEHRAGTQLFSEYGCLLCNSYLDGTIIYLADFDHDYGVIPYPKYDEQQENYRTMVDGNHEAMSVLVTETDLEFIGTMCEVLCAESYKQVMPAYFDVCLKQRYASSPEDAEMMDLCVNARVFDLGYVYDNWNGASFWFQDMLADASHPDMSSTYQKKAKVVEKYYGKVVKLFTGED
ncbi:MAG: hypothetical protein J6Q17_01910 [Clostridia bacterium]|nr:hypothetical protein [Clostridia bacterium]